MKKALLLFALLPTLAWGQRATEPFKNCTDITITTGLPDSTLFRGVGRYLTSQGWDIDKADREFMQFRTTERTWQNPIRYRYLISIRDGVVTWKGEMKLDYTLTIGLVSSPPAWEPLTNGPGRFKKLFEELRQTALAFYASFDGKEVYYSKR